VIQHPTAKSDITDFMSLTTAPQWTVWMMKTDMQMSEGYSRAGKRTDFAPGPPQAVFPKTFFGAGQATKIRLSIKQRIEIASKSFAACL
jgi:hypothetical protein